MVHLIVGPKGSGKTKKLIAAVNDAAKKASGDVVCIEYGKKLTYDVSHKARLVDAQECGICTANMFIGFLAGLHAGNFDITHIFIDNLYRTIGASREAVTEFILWCLEFSERNQIEMTITISDNPDLMSKEIQALI